jgi:hypothetical protein
MAMSKFSAARAQVVGVRLDRHGVGVHEDLEHVLVGQLARRAQVAFVALVQRFADGLVVLAGQFQAQPFVLDALAPQFLDLGVALGPLGLLAVVLVAFVGGEFKLALLDQLARIGDALVEALLVQVEDGERHAQVFAGDGVVQAGAHDGVLVDVGLGEEHLLRIQRLEVAVEDFLRHGVVQRHRLVVQFAQHARRPQGRLGLARLGLERVSAVFLARRRRPARQGRNTATNSICFFIGLLRNDINQCLLLPHSTG